MPKQMIEVEIPDNKVLGSVGVVRQDGLGNLHITFILHDKPVEPKYIPFTADTFRPHRDRWVRRKGSDREEQVVSIDTTTIDTCINVIGDFISFVELLADYEFINLDGSTEPCGQKVEGRYGKMP